VDAETFKLRDEFARVLADLFMERGWEVSAVGRAGPGVLAHLVDKPFLAVWSLDRPAIGARIYLLDDRVEIHGLDGESAEALLNEVFSGDLTVYRVSPRVWLRDT